MAYTKEERAAWWQDYKVRNADKVKAKNKKHNRAREKGFRSFIKVYKELRPCMDCGARYPYYVMQLDHVRGEKKFQLSQGTAKWSKDKTELFEEIAKCDLVCSNCHHHRTYLRRKGLPLGKLDVANQMLDAGMRGAPLPGAEGVDPDHMQEIESLASDPEFISRIAEIVMQFLGSGAPDAGAAPMPAPGAPVQ